MDPKFYFRLLEIIKQNLKEMWEEYTVFNGGDFNGIDQVNKLIKRFKI